MNVLPTLIILFFLLAWACIVYTRWKENQSGGNSILLLTPLLLFVLIFCIQFLDLRIKAKDFEVQKIADIERDQRLLKTTTEHIIRMIDILDQKPAYFDQSPPSKGIEESKKELKSLLDGKEQK